MMFVPQHVCAAKLLFNPPLKPSNTFLKQFECQTTGRAWLVGKRPTAGWDDQRKKNTWGQMKLKNMIPVEKTYKDFTDPTVLAVLSLE